MSSGYKDVIFRTVDTDVLVLVVAHFQDLEDIGKVWITFGTGKDFSYIPMHEIARGTGPDRSKGLPFFHALPSCYTTSYFENHGKTSAWSTWLTWPENTETFIALSSPTSTTLHDEVMQKFDRYEVLLYCRTIEEKTFNNARLTLFYQMSRQIDNIPPTKASLEEHMKRSHYQVGIFEDSALQRARVFQHRLIGDGKQRATDSSKKCTELPIAEKASLEIISCKCKKSCRGYCKCHIANSVCTALCTPWHRFCSLMIVSADSRTT